jgi:hypothetical protein
MQLKATGIKGSGASHVQSPLLFFSIFASHFLRDTILISLTEDEIVPYPESHSHAFQSNTVLRTCSVILNRPSKPLRHR